MHCALRIIFIRWHESFGYNSSMFSNFFFIFLLYYTQLIATFDEDREELIEVFNVTFFYFFCSIIILFFYKHSIHYFSFLEATVLGGRAVLFVVKQFLRDFINTFALLLRFFILLFRLNVYDTLDDFYDSYYVFMGDFDDDEYFIELLAPIFGLYFFDTDSCGDYSFLYKDEDDLTSNLFYYYFLCWGKLFFFIFFIVEEVLRVSLGLYICYLIVFEVHAVNRYYLEDAYFSDRRTAARFA